LTIANRHGFIFSLSALSRVGNTIDQHDEDDLRMIRNTMYHVYAYKLCVHNKFVLEFISPDVNNILDKYEINSQWGI